MNRRLFLSIIASMALMSLESAYADVRNNYSAYTLEYHRYQALNGAVKAADRKSVV